MAKAGTTAGRAALMRWLARGGMVVILIPVAAMGVAVGALAGWVRHSPPIEEFSSYNPPEATMILDRNSRTLAALYEQQRSVVRLEELPPILPHAFIAIEDERYYRHFGVDFIGIVRAMVINLQRGRFSQGGSTITQQTARNLVDRVGSEKTLLRKVREMLLAFQMEHDYSKDQILEVYLNQIYLGSGTYGVEAAAHRYFGKPVGDLTVVECATLAALPQIPERFSPLNNPDLSRSRRDLVLFKLLQLGYIDDREYNRTVLTELETNPRVLARTAAPYYVDAVRRVLADHPALEDGRLHTAGWQIRTTIDPERQQIAERVLREGLAEVESQWLALRQERYAETNWREEYSMPPAAGQVRMAAVRHIYSQSLVVELPGGWRADVPIPEATREWFQEGKLRPGWGVDIEVTSVHEERSLFHARLLPRHRLQGALVCLDAETGDVRALVGGRDFYDVENNGFFNRAVQARRQAGSTFKPFFFSAALEAGLSPETILVDQPLRFADGYSPRNYDGTFRGSVSMQYALEHSRNIPTINLVRRVGLRDSLLHVRRFQRTGRTTWDLPREWPTVLGSSSVTPMQMAAAYQPFANRGVARGPRLVEEIWTSNGRQTPPPDVPAAERLMSEQGAAVMTRMMTGVLQRGTGAHLTPLLPEELRSRVAGKSGTTNEHRDAWFAGYTPHEVVVVWVGFDQNVPLAQGQGGGRAAGPIFARYLAESWELMTPAERQKQLNLPAQPGYADASSVDRRTSRYTSDAFFRQLPGN